MYRQNREKFICFVYFLTREKLKSEFLTGKNVVKSNSINFTEGTRGSIQSPLLAYIRTKEGLLILYLICIFLCK